MKILAISGSLRVKSYNSVIIKTLNNMDKNIEVYQDLGNLPFYNPDIDIHTLIKDDSPRIVQEFRRKISRSDAIIISTPEYAFEIPGVLKNSLDWLVSSGELDNKPIAIISASTSAMGGDKANDILKNLIGVLTGNKNQHLTLTISKVNKKIENDKIIDTDLIDKLSILVNKLKEKI
jgi:NAD(P)H-dependent FMN reductase